MAVSGGGVLWYKAAPAGPWWVEVQFLSRQKRHFLAVDKYYVTLWREVSLVFVPGDGERWPGVVWSGHS